MSFPGRNECPGTHCSLIEQERKQFVPDLPGNWNKRKDGEERTTVKKEKRNGRLVDAAETNVELAE